MNRIKSSGFLRVISLILILTFISLDISYAYPPEHDGQGQNLAVWSGFQQNLAQSIFSKGPVVASVFDIAGYFFGKAEGGASSLPSEYAEYVVNSALREDLIRSGVEISRIVPVEEIIKTTDPAKLRVALDEIGFKGALPREDVIFVLFRTTKDNKKFLVQVAEKAKVNQNDLPGYEWVVSEKYVVKYLSDGHTKALAQPIAATETTEAPKATVSEPIAEIETSAIKSSETIPAPATKITIRAIISSVVFMLLSLSAFSGDGIAASQADSLFNSGLSTETRIYAAIGVMGIAIISFFVAYIIVLLKDGSTSVKKNAEINISEYVKKWNLHRSPSAIKAIFEILVRYQEVGNEADYGSAKKALAAIGSPIVPILRNNLRHKAPIRRKCAADILCRLGDVDLADDFVYLLNDEYSNICDLAEEALNIMKKGAIPALKRGMKDNDGITRSGVVLFLSKSGDEGIIKNLIEDCDAHVRSFDKRSLKVPDLFSRTLFTIGYGRERASIDTLIYYLSSENSELRLEAAKAIIGKSDPRAVRPLIKILRDGGDAGKYAGEALVEIGLASIKPLLEVLSSDDAFMRRSAASILDEFNWKRMSEGEQIRYLIAKEDQKRLIEMDFPAVDVLIEDLIGNDATAVRFAAETLSKMKVSPKQSLAEVLVRAKSRDQRRIVLEVLNNLNWSPQSEEEKSYFTEWKNQTSYEKLSEMLSPEIEKAINILKQRNSVDDNLLSMFDGRSFTPAEILRDPQLVALFTIVGNRRISEDKLVNFNISQAESYLLELSKDIPENMIDFIMKAFEQVEFIYKVKSISMDAKDRIKTPHQRFVASFIGNLRRGWNVKTNDESSCMVGLLSDIALNSDTYSVYVRQEAVSALRRIGNSQAMKVIEKAMEDPDMLTREVMLPEKCSKNDVVHEIKEALIWVLGEERVAKEYTDLDANINYMFNKNPGVLEFIKKYPFRIFSIKDKKKIDSVVLGNYRHYWFKAVGLIHTLIKNFTVREETARTVEIIEQDSPIDMSIGAELFVSRYLLAGVVHHEYLHYQGILSEGEVLLRQIIYMKSIMAEDLLPMSERDRNMCEAKMIYALARMGILSMGDYFTREMDEDYLATLNGDIMQAYGPDGMNDNEIKTAASNIINELESWIVVRNSILQLERVRDPSKKLYSPLGEERKAAIRRLVKKSKGIDNLVSGDSYASILKKESGRLRNWDSFRREGGIGIFEEKLKQARSIAQRSQRIGRESSLGMNDNGKTLYSGNPIVAIFAASSMVSILDSAKNFAFAHPVIMLIMSSSLLFAIWYKLYYEYFGKSKIVRLKYKKILAVSSDDKIKARLSARHMVAVIEESVLKELVNRGEMACEDLFSLVLSKTPESMTSLRAALEDVRPIAESKRAVTNDEISQAIAAATERRGLIERERDILHLALLGPGQGMGRSPDDKESQISKSEVTPERSAERFIEIIEEAAGSRRGEFVRDLNKIITVSGGADRAVLINGNKETTVGIIGRMETLSNPGIPDGTKAAIASLKGRLDQLEADSIIASSIAYGRRTVGNDNEFTLYFTTDDWMFAEGDESSEAFNNNAMRNATNDFIQQVESLQGRMRKLGFKFNVRHLKSAELTGVLRDMKDNPSPSSSCGLVLSSKGTIEASGITNESVDVNTRPFLAAIDPSELKDLRGGMNSNLSQVLDINMSILLSLALELGLGKDAPKNSENSPIIVTCDKGARKVIFLLRPRAIDWQKYKDSMDAKAKAIDIAA